MVLQATNIYLNWKCWMGVMTDKQYIRFKYMMVGMFLCLLCKINIYKTIDFIILTNLSKSLDQLIDKIFQSTMNENFLRYSLMTISNIFLFFCVLCFLISHLGHGKLTSTFSHVETTVILYFHFFFAKEVYIHAHSIIRS